MKQFYFISMSGFGKNFCYRLKWPKRANLKLSVGHLNSNFFCDSFPRKIILYFMGVEIFHKMLSNKTLSTEGSLHWSTWYFFEKVFNFQKLILNLILQVKLFRILNNCSFWFMSCLSKNVFILFFPCLWFHHPPTRILKTNSNLYRKNLKRIINFAHCLFIFLRLSFIKNRQVEKPLESQKQHSLEMS